MPARDWDESNGFRVVTDFLDVVADFLDDFFVSIFAVFWLGVVHLVDTNDELFDTKGESEKSVLSSLTVLSDTGFKFTNTGSEPLLLDKCKGSCGCTVPQCPKEPIAPGAAGEIEVKFNSKGKKNNQTKTVTINANTDPGQTILKIKAFVNPAEAK